ncbi:uncharacterized protein MELLADRAFT_108237 [Melampsora larici-populina 98AG31]|uniref:Uncharacterized protein n=1 Tax=Melampsora larici-populina (strain 98AG31 / pathotype 3-4-7) TaxID=747676 RepID=F4RSF3_MELLP|nr:uncharacterized protein MELLADRAFT_108237 [Melampsora larici-populina 98AG31]EGG04588.1 hypothetical protein MELLADRAFT_108237 [Melampsora larici-populina 98AG31]
MPHDHTDQIFDDVNPGSDTDSSDENMENLVEQSNEYDHGQDEDWETVVYDGPAIQNCGIKEGLVALHQQMNGWFPFEKLENVIGTMCYGSPRNQLSQTQYQTVHSAVGTVTHCSYDILSNEKIIPALL